jgi:hypothetical protein
MGRGTSGAVSPILRSKSEQAGARSAECFGEVPACLQQLSLRCNPFAHRLWVPSPLVGEGQDEGVRGTYTAGRPLTLALSHKGRRNLYAKARES